MKTGSSSAARTGIILGVDNFGALDPSRTAGVYTNVSGTTSGPGTGGTFNITVDGSGNVTSVVIVTGGFNHAVGDVITIADSALGNGGAADFTMSISHIGDSAAGGSAAGGSAAANIDDTIAELIAKFSALGLSNDEITDRIVEILGEAYRDKIRALVEKLCQ
jgi:hypothetical protein